MTTVFDAAGGDAGLLALARAWHERCLADPVASHPFEHGDLHPEHLERLAAYWAEALGGPTTFTDTMNDEADVLRMHAGNGEHRELDERAVACFDAALADVGLTDEPLRARAARLLRLVDRPDGACTPTPPTPSPTTSAFRTGTGTGSSPADPAPAGTGVRGRPWRSRRRPGARRSPWP